MKLFGGRHGKNHSAKEKDGRLRRAWHSLSGTQRGLILLGLSFLVLMGTVCAIAKSLIKPPELTAAPAVYAPPDPVSDENGEPVAPAALTTHQSIIYQDEAGEEVTFQFERPGSVREGFYNILLIGVDGDGTRTDTIIIARLDANKHTVAMMSVPRDTLINGNYTIPKINAVYGGSGKGEKGVNALRQQIASMLGIEVNGYALVDLKAFVELVDLVGGVNFYVPQRMYYTDPTQNLYIDLYEGEQLLDGQHAMQLVRYRSYAEADIKRTAVQQDFLRALAKKVVSFESIAKIKPMVEIALEYVDTDLTLGNLLYFAQELLSCDFDEMETVTLPGEGVWIDGGSYYALYPNQVREIVNESFNPYDADIPLSSFHIRGGGSSRPAPASAAPSKPVAKPAKDPEKSGEADPEEGDDPEHPVDPALPTDTENPIDPALPEEPETPTDPALPPETGGPGEPALPSEPEPPAEPVPPPEPEPPVDPALPSEQPQDSGFLERPE